MPAEAIADLRKSIITRLTPSVGSGEAAAMADAMLEDLLGMRRIDIAINPDRTVTDTTVGTVNNIVSRVNAGEPLQYVLGHAWFHGLKLDVGPGVLIPRPETSQLVDIITDDAGEATDLRILDVCTGSGAIAAALGRSLKFAILTAVDVSPRALEYARHNFAQLGLKADVIEMDVLKTPLPDGPFDIVVSNPPYVDDSERADMDTRVVDHEPSIALFVTDDNPLIFYKKITVEAFERLEGGGRLYFEINPRHAGDVIALVSAAGFENMQCLPDFEGRKRFVTACKPK